MLSDQELDFEAKAHAATLLLHFGSRTGVKPLLEMLNTGQGPVIHIVN